MNPDTQKTILIVEDDDFLRSLTVTKLQKEGFGVVTAADGQLGLDALAQSIPDIVLLDLMLPRVDGFQVLESIRNTEATKDLKVIIFSNLGREDEIKRGQDLGADEYLIKASFTLDELTEKIKEVLAR